VIDGVTVATNDRVLVYEQTDQTQNGVYVVTNTGSGSTHWVLTRAADADSYVINDANGLSEGSTFFVQQGTTGAGETYTCNTSGVITFGTTNITFAQISNAQIYSAGSGLALTGTVFSNTAPDQTVTLTQGGATTITGTYPNFTITSTDTTYTAGGGIGLTGTTFSVAAGSGLTQDTDGLSHADTSSQTSVDNTGAVFIQDVSLDAFGHVTSLASTTITTALIGAANAASPVFTGDVSIEDKIVHTGDTNTSIRFPAADTVTVETSGVERLRVDSSGNVGIGTSTPSERLTVNGTQAFVTTSGQLEVKAGNTVSFLDMDFTEATTAAVAPRFFRNTNTTGARIVRFFRGDGTANEDARIAVGGENSFFQLGGGNVGIGTNNPAQALSVNGSIDILAATTETRQLQIGQGRTGDGLSLIDFISDATYTDFGMRISRSAGANGTAFINVRGTGGLDIRTTDAAPILLQTNATERIRITSGGNVGIGTTSPTTRLDVNGSASAVFFENPQTITSNYTIVTGKSAMNTGPITIASGVTITVESGARYVVI
jgi:hypothetical protein